MDEAKQKLREMSAEPLSQRRIRAFPPNTTFRYLGTAASQSGNRLPPMEMGGCVFRITHSEMTTLLRRNARLERLGLGYDKPRVGSFCPMACGA